MWLGSDAIDGAADGANRLAAAGCSVVYVTNMSRLTVAQQQERLAGCGVRPPTEVVTSAVAAAALLSPGERVLVCGGEGIVEAVEAAGGVVVRNSAGGIAAAEPVVDAVVVGMDPSFDYAACGRAMRAVRAGARLIGTNHDPTYPTPAGLEAGGGAILAAVAAAAETEPTLAGKPHGAIVSCVRSRLGPRRRRGDRRPARQRRPARRGAGIRFRACAERRDVAAGVAGAAPAPRSWRRDLAGVVDALL